MQCPSKTETDFYNYKRNYSILLSALVDSDHHFIFADVGSKERLIFLSLKIISVFRNTNFGLLWQKNEVRRLEFA